VFLPVARSKSTGVRFISQPFTRIVSWNIRAGGGRRSDQILRQLLDWEPDVIGLCEFRGTPASQELAQRLAESGFPNQLMTTRDRSPARNALLLASRFPLQLTPVLKMPKNRERWLLAKIESVSAFTIGLMHVPNYTTPKLKYPFLTAVHKMVDSQDLGPTLLIGDTNCGKRGIDEENTQPARFYREHDWIAGFDDRGWVDAFRHLHGDKREYSWYSHRNNGFRLDYAFCSPELKASIKAAQYVWGSDPENIRRREALSDHAALIVDIENQSAKSVKSCYVSNK